MNKLTPLQACVVAWARKRGYVDEARRLELQYRVRNAMDAATRARIAATWRWCAAKTEKNK